MREYVSREKKTTTGFSIPSLKHPIPGFGLKSSAISRQAVSGIQPLHKPVTHDISRIPLRSQAKLSISQPGDIYEQEADNVAQQVMQRMAQPVNSKSIQREALSQEDEELQMKPLASSITPLVQREASPEEDEELQMKSLDNSTLQREASPEEDEELQMKSLDNRTLQREASPEEDEELQMKSLDNRTLQREALPEEEEELQMKSMVQRQGEAGMDAAPDLEASINQARGGGQTMANNIREPMEQAFGADFSGVKVHTDGQSDQLNRSIQARAFTTGQDVFFRQGEYNPGSRGGQELLAHELTHVVQQNGGAVQRSPQLPHEAGHEGTGDTGVINLPPNHITLGKLTGRIDTTERQEDVPVVQRALDQKTIEKNINIAALSASEYERLLYWNEDGKLDELKSQQVEVVKKKLLEWARKPHPKEKPEEESKQNTLPKWMHRYEQFSVSLPNHLGGGALTFRKRAEFVVFENRGWISNNKVIKIEGHKQSYMLHLILEWKDPSQETPNPHITIRTLEAQSNIILDTIAPRSGKRSQGLEATKSSLSVGIGDNERKQGDALNLPDEQEQNLKSEATLNWLKERVIEEVKRAEITP